MRPLLLLLLRLFVRLFHSCLKMELSVIEKMHEAAMFDRFDLEFAREKMEL